ncbi:MAG: hypothetical protein H7Z42_21235 [Roseiflexaceae bacterium]|nr:hypothetical protein [Roseiflexaceae bacterium]
MIVRRVRLSCGLLALVLLALAGCGSGSSGIASELRPPTVTQATARPVAHSGLPQMLVGELPPEGRKTLQLIADGGPFPYARDGVTFQNRERLLPRHASGYYHEYTVPTPGENDRGARRLVVGQAGEVYYTKDHYESFVEVLP